MTRFLALLLLSIAMLLGACGDDGRDAPEPAAPNANDLSVVPDVVQELQPSVVAVQVAGRGGAGEGSGVVWGDGLIVTNNHVVEGAERVRIVLADGRRLSGEVRATDPRTDLALVEVAQDDLPAARFATALPRVGELAIALGNPLGFENTVTTGVVSGVDRALPTGGRTPALIGLLQTDAAISPGNSGGALLDGEGRVIGINVAYIPPQARAVSLGFAIPAPVVRRVVEELLADGEVQHPYLGVQLTPLTPQIAQRLGVETGEGVILAEVDATGPAGRAGLEAGSVITSLDGRPVRQIEDVLTALRDHRPGDTVPAIVLDDGEPRTVQITLGERP